ncbi:MAG: PadR family transcriptional regulator [Clostridiales bacterium GWC2_40_7]|nr:MAG: PadR family transcriptional regulator [Clostridiales bacterium GWC2_40_7]
MDAQMKKGLLDVCVLNILKREDTYGYKLTQEVTRFLETSESALYPVLRRHESQGWLETYTSEHSGRLRKYYKITAQGITRLNEFIDELKEMKAIIDYIIGGGNNG